MKRWFIAICALMTVFSLLFLRLAIGMLPYAVAFLSITSISR